jgi:hypothetical protein
LTIFLSQEVARWREVFKKKVEGTENQRCPNYYDSIYELGD